MRELPHLAARLYDTPLMIARPKLETIVTAIGGRCWADEELNTPDQVAQGKVYFDFDFTPPYPAERVTFRSHLVHDYIEEVFK